MRYIKKKNTVSSAILAVIILIAAVLYYFVNLPDDIKLSDSAESNGPDVTIHFIDVGQGDAAFIDNGEKDILIDAGPKSSASDLIAYLDALGVKTIDYIFFSHPHEDHIGGAESVIGRYSIKNVVMPDFYEDSESYRALMRGVDFEGCELIYAAAGDSFEIGGLSVDILSPKPKYRSDDTNGASLVMKVSYGEIDTLFTGDAEFEAEEYMLKNYSDELDCEILKVAHHGSSTSSSENFIYAVSPEVALISVGFDNGYGHPHDETMELLDGCVENILRTDKSGDIAIALTKDKYWLAK